MGNVEVDAVTSKYPVKLPRSKGEKVAYWIGRGVFLITAMVCMTLVESAVKVVALYALWELSWLNYDAWKERR